VMGFRERDQLVPGRVREQVARHRRGRYEGPAGVRFLVGDGGAAGGWGGEKAAGGAPPAGAPGGRGQPAPPEAGGGRLPRGLRCGCEAGGGALRRVSRRRARAHGRMTTGVPSGTTRMSQRRSLSRAWTQPAETAWPKSLDESVPWIAIRSPPDQPRGRFGWV